MQKEASSDGSLQGTSVGDLIRMTVERTGYEKYLRTSQQDFDSRLENVNELVCLCFLTAP